jgi:hypothetical protein
MQNNFTAYSSLVERKPLAFKTEEAEQRRRLCKIKASQSLCARSGATIDSPTPQTRGNWLFLKIL